MIFISIGVHTASPMRVPNPIYSSKNGRVLYPVQSASVNFLAQVLSEAQQVLLQSSPALAQPSGLQPCKGLEKPLVWHEACYKRRVVIRNSIVAIHVN